MACDWFIKRINVVGMTVNFYIAISGNSWTIVLKDSKGTVEAQKSGTGYGDHSLTAKTSGAHTLELTGDWSSSLLPEICPVNIGGAVFGTEPPTTPPAASPPTGTSSSFWKDKDTYVGYYQCADPAFKCPDESQAPGWKKISQKVMSGLGGYGGCGNCIMTEIIWQRIATSPPPASGCTEGTTRTVKCPKNGKYVTQKCVGGSWVTMPGEESKCSSDDTARAIIAAVILVIIILFLRRV